MVNDANGKWIGLGLGDADDPKTPRTAPNWNAVLLLNTALYKKYTWARALGVTIKSTYDAVTAAAVEQFCLRVNLPVVKDPHGFAVANLATRTRLGSYPPPRPILPVMFTVEGHLSNMWAGPAADTAAELEREGACHHQPIGYNCGALPFDNASGVNELARLVGSQTLDDHTPFPTGTKWILGVYSQGAIVGSDFYIQHLMPGCDLAWRTPDLVGVLAYGNPCRETGSVAPWSRDQAGPAANGGLDPLKRFGLKGFPEKPVNWMDVYRKGDIFADNEPTKEGEVKSAIYQAVARTDFFSNPTSILTQIMDLYSKTWDEVYGMFLAIVSGIGFIMPGANPHYAPFNLDGGLSWLRTQLPTQH